MYVGRPDQGHCMRPVHAAALASNTGLSAAFLPCSRSLLQGLEQMQVEGAILGVEVVGQMQWDSVQQT